MNLEQMKARFATIVAKLKEFHALESFTNEELEEINQLNDELSGLKNTIEAKEKLAAIDVMAATPTRKTTPDAPVARMEVTPSREEKNGGFKNLGEFLNSVKKASNGDLDKRFKNSAMFEKNGEDGGFLVPEEMMTEVTKKIQSDESLLARTRQFTVSGNALSLPTDETSPWTGGIVSKWLAEGEQYSETKHKFGTASWRLHKLGAIVRVTDELLEDSTALESYIRSMAPVSIMHQINSAILTGNGVGKPQGILNSNFKVKVQKEAGQTADTIVAKNIIKMYSKMIPSARANAVWYINAACEEQLRMMKDDEGAFIYLAPGSQLNQTPYGLLMGRPVLPMIGSMPALGDEGDIVFADLSYYYTILKSGGMKQAISSHLWFDRDIQAYKFTMRIDGACPFKAPVKTEFGNYEMSAFVTLEDRA